MEEHEEMFGLKNLSEAGLQAILDLTLRHCTRFSLVRYSFASCGRELEKTIVGLQPFHLKDERTDAWPGTELLGGRAKSDLYEISEASIAILKRARFLFSGELSKNMADLAFYTKDGKPWMYTIAHETVFFIDKAALPEADQSELLELLHADKKPIVI